MDNNFKVKVGEFEGPLDLLLTLIEKRRLHISTISLAQVADDYVTHLEQNREASMETMANFILVASTLMLIKSLSLLPGLAISEEERSDISNLEQKLEKLKKIRALSFTLKEQFGKTIIFSPQKERPKITSFSPPKDLNQAGLSWLIKELIKNLPRPEIRPEKIIKKIISLEEIIDQLAKRVGQAMKLSFADFVLDKKEKIDVIVSFLGMLELVKQGAIKVEQSAQFSNIDIESQAVGVPRY